MKTRYEQDTARQRDLGPRRLADEPITLETLADEFGVSRERVRQIEVRAFEKVQKAVQHRVAAMERAEPTWIAHLNEVSGAAPSASSSIVLNTPFIVG
jgi:hypothetical protein